MRVISTDLLIQTASLAMFEAEENPATDIQHVIDFLTLMSETYGFEIEQEEPKRMYRGGRGEMRHESMMNNMMCQRNPGASEKTYEPVADQPEKS